MIGTKLSHFEITDKLGEGGMGAVYRAKDTKLDREVAIKVLPEAFVADPERLARFEREAKVLASLNHPGIAGVFEVGEVSPDVGAELDSARAEASSAPTRFLVMELADGEDLSERLGRGAIPTEQALEIAVQLADALEAAHESGIVHRDLKPANIKITTDDKIKILDFGLAKAWETPGGSSDMTRSPTLTAQMTQAGTLLGTAAYMSPEQARGMEADRRADVWAFGLILTEMLSGKKTFNEPTVSDTLAAVLKTDPDLAVLPADLSPTVRRLIERCLRKDPRERLRDMGDVGLELREVVAGEAEPLMAATGGQMVSPDPSQRLSTNLLAGALVGLVVAVAAWALLPSRKSADTVTAPQVVLFDITAPLEVSSFVRGLAVSPDGSSVAMTVRQSNDNTAIWLRSLDSLEARAIPGTEGGRWPFWKPDGGQIGFFADGQLKIVDLLGSPPRSLASTAISGEARGASWSSDGTILFAPIYSGGLKRISEDGGEPEPATVLDPEGDIGTHRFPWFLPDGRHFLVYGSSGTGMEPGKVLLGEIGSPETRELGESHSAPVFAPPDQVLFVNGDVLMTQTLDVDQWRLVGAPVPLGPKLPGGLAVSGSRSLSASRNGTVVYRVEDLSRTRLAWFDRNGNELGTLDDDQAWHIGPSISPDGQFAAVSRYAPDNPSGEIWIFDRERGLGRPISSADDGDEDTAVFSRDGRRIGFVHSAGAGQMVRVLDVARPGTSLVLYTAPAGTSPWPTQWLPEDEGLLLNRAGVSDDIVALYLDNPGELVDVIATDRFESDGQISPDGRWLAFTSGMSGRREVYVQPWEGEGGLWQISTEGGGRSRWSADGSEVFFVGRDGWLNVAQVIDSESFATGPPVRLFDANIAQDSTDVGYEVAPDGAILINQKVDDPGEPITVVIGFEQKLPGVAVSD